jgi:hypothetical protein
MGRVCSDCGRSLPQTSYTANQWSKGQGISRCAGCVHGHHRDAPAAQPSDSGRYNHADRSEFTYHALQSPFASGAFRWVAKGRYTDGDREGQACVAKWFKTGAVFDEDYFTLDIKAVDKALEIVNRFNQLDVVDKIVKMNVPAVWSFEDYVSDDWAGQKALCEPFIQGYQKFNSNSGWNDDSRAWARVMQALSRTYNPGCLIPYLPLLFVERVPPFSRPLSLETGPTLTLLVRLQLPHFRRKLRLVRPPRRNLPTGNRLV